MKKAVAVSCLCFIISTALVSCGENNSSSSKNENSRTSVTTGSVTTDYRNSDDDSDVTFPVITSDRDGFMDPDSGDIEENGVMPDATSPLEMIPDAIETAVNDAGDVVSDIMDDLT